MMDWLNIIGNAIVVCIGIIIWIGNRKIEQAKHGAPTPSDYLHKLHLILGVSDFEIFKIAAAEKGNHSYEEHFDQYLKDGSLPHYLIEFLDEGKEYIEKYNVKTWVN